MPDRRPLGNLFTRLLSGHTISQLGVGAHAAAVPLIAVTLTSNVRIIAALALVSSIPALLLALPIGVWVDRSHRGRLMVGADLLSCVVLATVGVAAALGHLAIWMLFIAMTVIGLAQLVFGTATFALMPTLVPKSELTRANGYLAVGAQTSGGVVGPPLGGLLFAASPFLAFATAASSYLASALMIARLARNPDPRRSPRSEENQETRREALAAGLRYVARHRAVRATTVLSGAFGLFGWMPEATLVLFARETLQVSPTGFGVLLAVTTLGAVAGALTLRRLTARIGTRRLIVGTHLLYGLLLIPVGLTDNAWIVGAVFFIQGIPLIASAAAVRSLQQSLVPDDLLGRVGAVNRLAVGVSAPLGMAAGGMLAYWVGYSAVWVIAGVACTVVSLALARATLEPGLDERT